MKQQELSRATTVVHFEVIRFTNISLRHTPSWHHTATHQDPQKRFTGEGGLLCQFRHASSSFLSQ